MTNLFVLVPLLILLVVPDAIYAVNEIAATSERDFCALDRNNDRSISFEEFSSCEFYKFEHLRKLPYTELKDLKRDSSGLIPEEDLKQYLFNKADKNKNGTVNRQEWEEFYNSIMDPGGSLSRHRFDRR